jgi:hypothetical protein
MRSTKKSGITTIEPTMLSCLNFSIIATDGQNGLVVYDILRKKKEEKNKNNGAVFIQCPMPSLIIVPSDCIGDRKDRKECRDPHFHYI